MTPPTPRVRFGLDALNFFLADIRAGLGPYLAIYLLSVEGASKGWNPETIGVVMTIAGIAGIVAQMPAGALIDGSRHKRGLIVAAAVAVTAASLTLPWLSGFYAVAITQSVAGVAEAVLTPAVAAITLGIVGQKTMAARVGRNEAFNHGGNAVSAALAAGLALLYGPIVVFWIMAGFAAASVVSTLIIPAAAIDDACARGFEHGSGPDEAEKPSGLRALLQNRSLLIFAVLVATFHLANAAMLPSVGQKLTTIVGKGSATSLIAVCIIAAQCVMVPVAIVVGKRAQQWGSKPIFLAAYGVLAVRGALYTVSDDPYWLVGVQLLDGVGAGIYGALFPVVIADLTRGTGRFNVSQGAVATAQSIGAAVSSTVAGAIIVHFGYSAAFIALGAIAAAGFLAYLLLMPETRKSVGEAPAPVAKT